MLRTLLVVMLLVVPAASKGMNDSCLSPTDQQNVSSLPQNADDLKAQLHKSCESCNSTSGNYTSWKEKVVNIYAQLHALKVLPEPYVYVWVEKGYDFDKLGAWQTTRIHPFTFTYSEQHKEFICTEFGGLKYDDDVSGPLVNATNKHGNTPLMVSSYLGIRALTAYWLKQPDVDVSLRAHNGETVFDMVERSIEEAKDEPSIARCRLVRDDLIAYRKPIEQQVDIGTQQKFPEELREIIVDYVTFNTSSPEKLHNNQTKDTVIHDEQ